MRHATIFLALLLIGLAVSTAESQERTQRSDSLEVEVRRLRARLDSLERVLGELLRAGRDTAAVQDELAQLRAAAQAAAGERGAADTLRGQESRTRNLQILNPEIGVTGDLVGVYGAPSGESGSGTAVPREFEFSFQSGLDPYARAKVFVSKHEEIEIAGLTHGEEDGTAEHEEHGGFEIEEAYLYWIGAPGGIGIKAGKIRQEIGLYNRWHTHALWEVERPLPTQAFLGEGGLIQTGVSLTSPSLVLGPATQTAFFELTAGTSDALFAGGNQPSYLGRLQSFWNTSGTSYIQLGATGLWGQNDDEALTSQVVGLDFLFRWGPPGRTLYREFHLKGEWYFAEREVAGTRETGSGGYGQANFRLNRRWILGARVDYLDHYGDEPSIVQLVPSLTWWQSEWVRLRLQYHHVRPDSGGSSHTVLLQVVFAMGPHKHESY